MKFRMSLLGPVCAFGALALSAGLAHASPLDADSWSGPYVGALTGARSTSSHFELPGDRGDVLLSDHESRWSWFGGGVAGWNFQPNPGVVLGLEADILGGDSKQAVTACTVPDGCWTPTHDSFTTINRLKQTLTGHVRARLGLVRGRNLFYLAGGYSYAKTRLDLIGECYNPGNPATPLLFTFNRSKTLSGFNLGAGVDRRLGEHVSIRAEYVYDDFGDQLYPGDGAEWNDRRIRVRSSNLRLGVSYRF